jgi:hypothetical protein
MWKIVSKIHSNKRSKAKHPDYMEVVHINFNLSKENRFEWDFPMKIEYEHFQQMKIKYATFVSDKSYAELAEMFDDLFKFRNSRIEELIRVLWGQEPIKQIANKVGEVIADVWPMQLVLRDKMAELKGLTLDQVNAVSGGTTQ